MALVNQVEMSSGQLVRIITQDSNTDNIMDMTKENFAYFDSSKNL